jgi:fructokinase
MLIGIDWGGTKIESIALRDEGREIIRVREDTPRCDYQGCIRIIAANLLRLSLIYEIRGLFLIFGFWVK